MKIFGLLLFSLFLTSCERTGDQQVAVELESPLSLAAVSSNFSLKPSNAFFTPFPSHFCCGFLKST